MRAIRSATRRHRASYDPDGMGRWETLRASARSAARAARDRLDVLEQLYGVAAVTTFVLLVIGIAVDRGLIAAPPHWVDPAIGFAVAAAVSGVGYWAARSRRRERLRDVAAATSALVDAPIGSGITAPGFHSTSLRELARLAIDDHLLDGLGTLEYGPHVASRLYALIDAFERVVLRSVGELAPPRANGLAAQAARQLREATAAIDAFLDHRNALFASELRGDATARNAALADDVKGIAAPARAGVGACEALESLYDEKAAVAARARRDRAAVHGSEVRRGLQATVVEAAEALLHELRPGFLEQSTLRRWDADLAAIVSAKPFAFDAEIEDEALMDWRKRIDRAHEVFRLPIEGRGLEMAPATHSAWVDVNGAVLSTDRCITRLLENLATSRKEGGDTPAVLERIEEDRGAVQNSVREVLMLIDPLRALEVR